MIRASATCEQPTLMFPPRTASVPASVVASAFKDVQGWPRNVLRSRAAAPEADWAALWPQGPQEAPTSSSSSRVGMSIWADATRHGQLLLRSRHRHQGQVRATHSIPTGAQAIFSFNPHWSAGRCLLNSKQGRWCVEANANVQALYRFCRPYNSTLPSVAGTSSKDS